MTEECEYCIKQKTMYCPNSSECYCLDSLPYFQTNLDLLKENTQLKKQIDEVKELFKDYNISKPASGLSQCTYEITAEDMYKLSQILSKLEEAGK